MLDIQKMIETNDFSDLINSTEESRKKSGGDNSIYHELEEYLHFSIIKEILRETFKNNPEILADLNEQNRVIQSENARIKVTHNDVDYFIQLPE